MPEQSTSHFNLRMPMEVRLRPWIRAQTLDSADLYRKAVSSFPCRLLEKQWQAEFLCLLAAELATDGLAPCCFLDAAGLQGEPARKFAEDAGALAPVPG